MKKMPIFKPIDDYDEVVVLKPTINNCHVTFAYRLLTVFSSGGRLLLSSVPLGGCPCKDANPQWDTAMTSIAVEI